MSEWAGFIFKNDNVIKVGYGTFGYRRADGSVHRGVDISTTGDPEIHAVRGGRVKYARCVAKGAAGWGSTWQWGYFVWVVGDDGRDYIYAHCKADSLRVKEGQGVEAGQVLAKMGSTGNAAFDAQGAHVHFEVRKNGAAVEPTAYCGIPNKAGVYCAGALQQAGAGKYKILTPMEQAASSQNVSEGVIAVMGSDGRLRGYNLKGGARLAREYGAGAKSTIFEAVCGEMQPGEMVMAEGAGHD